MVSQKAIPSGNPVSGPHPHQIFAIIGILHALCYLKCTLKHMAVVYRWVERVQVICVLINNLYT